jgi:hypothetical protein
MSAPADSVPRKRMNHYRVTLTDQLRDAVEAHATAIALSGEEPNFSAAVRDIIREWQEAKTPKKSAKKKREGA